MKPHIFKQKGFWLVHYSHNGKSHYYQAFNLADARDFSIFAWGLDK